MRPEVSEWDVEFAASAMLPFHSNAARLTSEAKAGERTRVGCGNLQVRPCDLVGPLKGLDYQIARATSVLFEPREVKGEVNGAWRRILISYARHHYDYEATAHVDFRLRCFGDRARCCFSRNPLSREVRTEIPRIVKSVRPGSSRGIEVVSQP